MFDILSNARRRYVLYYLREADEPVELGELARELAAWENDTTVEELTKQQRKRVYVSLYQTHIPKLEDAGVVEYDQDSGTVRLTSRADEIEDYLGGDAGVTVPWQVLYLGLAVASAALFLGVAFEVGALATVSLITLGILVSVAFGIVALAHILYTQWIGRRRNLTQLEQEEA